MLNQDDPRVQRTQKLIRETFRELLQNKEFEEITIKDIAQKASINRATFYNHYADKYALLEEITFMAFDNMIPEQIAQAQGFTEDVCRQFIELTYSYIISFYRTCRFSTKSVAAQVDGQMKRNLHRSIESLLRKGGDSVHVTINAAMISAAIYNAAYYWYETNKDDNVEQLTDAVILFLNNGLQMKNS
ncbi:TetR family transcriptional regulator [Paenibacillus sp. LC-T2]|uniref:TetR family transcriptional regulator n=2 Tax=Paenibacillus monticola TaxID=2666075 RepID=A0A7X2H5K1_9BACL|nr:TetR family transcriptional regulator [Paenibacillus monticola]